MFILKTLRNYLCYCGIEKDEYKELKIDAYISNFQIWRLLHCLMTVAFAALFILSFSVDVMHDNMIFYLVAFLYSMVVSCLFLFVFKKESLIAQLVIYLSISLLLLVAAFITSKKPEYPAATFLVFLIIAPMFMVDKPYFMAIELTAASAIYLVWMHGIKPDYVWKMDVVNVIIFALIGFIIHVILNSIRVKEFVLNRTINIQKDLDDMTGLMNKGAMTREINNFLSDETGTKGIMFLLDIDHFKSVNDTYGHDVGDSVINQLGVFLGETFGSEDIVGRFGGDEFIVFIKNTDDPEIAKNMAEKVINGAAEHVKLPSPGTEISVSIGISIYKGVEKNYSEIFKKADIALYKVKSIRAKKYDIFLDLDY
ncbi:MAG: GGDEF domain-containing protein [Clostridia bacterium]|nr:GGDEF domain-containing protein [Clostridia bacterium]